MRTSLCFFVLTLYAPLVFGQLVNDRLILNLEKTKTLYSKGSLNHTSFKNSFEVRDSLAECLLCIFHSQKEGNYFTLNPAFDFLFGLQNEEENTIYRHSIGADVNAHTNKWTLGFTYLRNMGRYMNYQRDFVRKYHTVPGNNVSSGADVLEGDYFSSFLNYKANDFVDLEIGYGRNFIGDGYRSLLLSDFANASPYLKVRTKFWKLEYTNLFTAHQNIFNVEGKTSLYKRKYSATHYLDWTALPWLSIGLFETIIWQAEEANYTRGFDVNYLNPFIFYRPVEFSVGSSDNALVGANIKITPFDNHVFYSQLVFDEFLLDELRADFNQFRNPDQDIRSGWWANKYGIQLGWTSFDLFKIKGLQTRLEFNLVRPYTYAHTSPTQAYSNYNLSLAHPLGANFHELVSIVNYQNKRWVGKLQFNQSRRGESPEGENFGENLQLSNESRFREYENTLNQGIPIVTKFAEVNVGYVIDKNINSVLSLGMIWRQEDNGSKSNNSSFFLSFKTNLFNQYWDH